MRPVANKLFAKVDVYLHLCAKLLPESYVDAIGCRSLIIGFYFQANINIVRLRLCDFELSQSRPIAQGICHSIGDISLTVD